MLKRYKAVMIITILLCLIPMAAGLILWDRLPDPMATHCGIDGEPNGWSSKAFTVFGMPLFLAVMELVCAVAMSLDPKSRNIAAKPLLVVFITMPVVSWFMAFTIYGYALGHRLNVGSLCCILIGALFIALGNYMPKNARNYSFGVRTPWALDDDENWTHTNRVGSICFMVSGAVTLLTGLLTLKKTGAGTACFIVIMAAALISSAVTIVYSYLYFRKHGKGSGKDKNEAE